MGKLGRHKNIERLNKVTHTIRSSQAILQYGVGAMVDFPDQTLMTAAPEYWETKVSKIHDERLEKALKVDYFGMPGNSKYKDDWGIAYARFPEWYFCPKCRKFQPLKAWIREFTKKATTKQKEIDPNMRRPRCMECRQSLVPSRIVLACTNGHIDDFPWELWAHERNVSGRRDVCANPTITFETGATASAGLEGLNVKCKNCKSRATLKGAFDKEAMEKLGSRCTGRMPWKNHSVDCNHFPRAMQRGASSLYYPKVVSSLVIPPYSEKINEEIVNSKYFEKALNYIEYCDESERQENIKKNLDKWSEEISRELSTDKKVISNILYRRLIESDTDSEVVNANGLQYRIEEFEALSGQISINNLSENDFVREETDITLYDIPFVKDISLIHKIREVRALTGFTRLNPSAANEIGEEIPGFISVKEPKTRWYPGYEVRGEGIFIEFNNADINHWLEKNLNTINKRIKTINDHYQASYQGEYTSRIITPKFVLLHTIAHLLVRQLSFECGYTAASLRERLYCSEPEDGVEMSAILIYTASGDSEGTLGGLVRQGYWDCLPRTFKKAIEFGELCSNDPVCISSKGQGRDALNLASCHSCGLLPETSCEEFNVFLDRALVVGTFEDKEIGFYKDWLLR